MSKVTNPLQEKMKQDLQKIRSSKKFIVEADKTSNLYSVKPELYSRHLQNNITKEYSKSTSESVDKI